MLQQKEKSVNTTLDIMKFVFAILVVGIHTEPFGFNVWLDRGFGIITKLCVPFFFIAGAYFFWIKEKSALKYIKRILLLYVIWSLIYLPFDIKSLSNMSVWGIIRLFFWYGNTHALWYLWGTIIGFLMTFLLLKFLKPKTVLVIAFVFLLIGCIKSTWFPIFKDIFVNSQPDFYGSRNGLFYAFPYTALGMNIAKSQNKGKTDNIKKLTLGLIISTIALVIESLVFIVIFKTTITVIWLSVFPMAYFAFMLGNNITVNCRQNIALYLRKMSTLIFVSQYLFISLYSGFGIHNMLLFLLSALSAAVFSICIITLSNLKYFKWLKYLY
ncbi:MAG: acyltransferase family protein [Clostridiales bacterium]|nr:acyltransferase family protein [Candidatus Equinaster intestinalis]